MTRNKVMNGIVYDVEYGKYIKETYMPACTETREKINCGLSCSTCKNSLTLSDYVCDHIGLIWGKDNNDFCTNKKVKNI